MPPCKAKRVCQIFDANWAQEHEVSDWFSVNLGIGQGDIQGPPIFNFCLNFWTFEAEVNKAISHGAILQKKLKGVEEKVVIDTDYADDIQWAILAQPL